MKIKRSFAGTGFDNLNALLLVFACLLVLAPLAHVVAGSLSTTNALIHSQVSLWPVGFNLDNYRLVFQNETFWRSFGVTLYVVCIGTFVNMVLTVFTAYPLSKGYLKGRKLLMLFVIFTMIFQAPMIPSYLLVKYLGMIDSLWSLIVPGALSVFNMILCITFFRSLPEEMFEAARVDGLSEYRAVWQIALPLSMPIIVTLILFYAVAHWNNYYSALLYITDPKLRPLQLYLYMLLTQYNTNDAQSFMSSIVNTDVSPQGLQMATIVVATLPVLLIYPFVQKHFIKGSLLGSLKE
ncbi:putative aldouronate transport system permease protein [Paenibacillus sp. UNCCL117]|uniref:carbohydrate ABC transporter permease n=1 Tax=unclassified Paenibacillus TaxID=185978 RepID=UPI0008876962|nr:MULTISPECIES: carbohydrate ABC transporter permease [unclassified Paenibacillus]SDD65475.1 putative aldouronate transport system permease protein [Paenibacillus sp. cl123]SFW58116.1 putative aldouronate transport system permease protein [Paenibacillus sp. UNCCL117]